MKVEESIQLGQMICKNRLVRSAVHTFLGNTDGTMSEAEYNAYEELAKNQIGLIITGHCSVSPQGMANTEQTAIYADRFISQFTQLKQRVEQYGSKLVVQINHAGDRAVGVVDLAGVMARELKKGRSCRMLTVEEIAVIREQFIAAACRLQQAGVDGVQIHAAHSYLLSQFLDETFNQRDDAYGGSVENRFRLLGEIISGIRARCGAEFVILVKINSDNRADDVQYEADLAAILAHCEQLGVTAVELSGCDFITQPKEARTYYLPRAAKLRQGIRMPLILVGGVRCLDDMEVVLASGIDMVALGRPLICEPDFFSKALADNAESACLSCNRCFVVAKIRAGLRCVLHSRKNAKRE